MRPQILPWYGAKQQSLYANWASCALLLQVSSVPARGFDMLLNDA